MHIYHLIPVNVHIRLVISNTDSTFLEHTFTLYMCACAKIIVGKTVRLQMYKFSYKCSEFSNLFHSPKTYV